MPRIPGGEGLQTNNCFGAKKDLPWFLHQRMELIGVTGASQSFFHSRHDGMHFEVDSTPIWGSE